MRIALLRPLSRPPSYDPEIQEPLGLESLTAVLRAAGHEVLLQDLMLLAQTEERSAHGVARFRPDVLGVSLMSDVDVESANAMVARVQDLVSTPVTVVAGGSFVSTEPERAARLLPEGALLVQYEGERPLLRLVQALESGQGPADIPSVLWRRGRRLHRPPAYEGVGDLDALPPPARDTAKSVAEGVGVLNVQGSRGCSGSCGYCCMPGVVAATGRGWRGRSPALVVEELATLKRTFGVAAFNFVDDDFLGPPPGAEERAQAFAEAVAQCHLRIGFGAQFRPHTFTPEAACRLAAAGLAWAFLGMENDDPQTLAEWHRPPLTADTWHLVALLRAHQVAVAAGAILFHPRSTLEGVRRFAAALAAHGLLNYRTGTSRLHLLPGSRLYEQYRRDGRLPRGLRGAFTPPLQDARLEHLFRRLVQSLSPLRPVWVHAACQLPGAVSRHKAGCPGSPQLGVLRGVLQELDGEVCKTLFSLLTQGDAQEPVASAALARARASNRALADHGVSTLQRAGLVADPQHLHDAIALEGRA